MELDCLHTAKNEEMPCSSMRLMDNILIRHLKLSQSRILICMSRTRKPKKSKLFMNIFNVKQTRITLNAQTLGLTALPS